MTTSRTKFGFTMVELLVVIVIMGVLTAIIVPSMTGADIARVRSAVRGVMQTSRYARTMAILRQQTVMLELTTDGTLRVSGTESGGEGASSADSAAGASGSSSETTIGTGGGSAGAEMSELGTVKRYEQVRFVVALDEDALSETEAEEEIHLEEEEQAEEAGAEEGRVKRPATKTVRIPYESNGRCLPYRVTVLSGTVEDEEAGQVADKAVLVVDRFGNVRVEEDER